MAKKSNKSTKKLHVKKSVAKKAGKPSPAKAVKKSVSKVSKAPAPKVKERKSTHIPSKKEVDEAPEAESMHMKEVDTIVSNTLFADFVNKNVGKQGVELLGSLNKEAHTDDKLALKMNIKVNEVRRMLNVLNGFGITKYDINKDGKGWLTFRWYLDRSKLVAFNSVLQEKQSSENLKLQEDCNDFFYCLNCYKDQKIILPFDSAFEVGFRCECGKSLAIIDKTRAVEMFKDTVPA